MPFLSLRMCVAIGNIKTGGCLHIDFFLEMSIEVSSFDIHLVDLKVVLGCECKDSMKGGKFGDRGKRLVEVNALDLGETLGDNLSFIFLNTSVRATLDMEHPFASNDLLSFWLRDNVINV
jgi:hypothetical protein